MFSIEWLFAFAAIPVGVAVWMVAARLRSPKPITDQRGIALQTIIIIVVMLAIAGAVATVLFTRAGTETDRLEQETDRWSDINSYTGCNIAGGRPSSTGGSTFTATTDPDDFDTCFPPLP